MEVHLDINGTDVVLSNLQNLQSVIENCAEGLREAADSTILPEVENRSTEVWNVRTGTYSSSWYTQTTGPSSIIVGNQINYSSPLEYGWTTRGGSSVSSPGVLLPATLDNIDAFVEAFRTWLLSQVPQV